MKRIVILFILIALACPAVYGGITNTKHNLSVSGPGSVKSSQESEICVFCHAPHNTNPDTPLWNRELSYQTTKPYTPYSSPTIDASIRPGQPRGDSRLCLSCHDGTVAPGRVLNPGRERGDESKDKPRSRTDPSLSSPMVKSMGTDLSGTHPISFVYDDNLADRNNARDHYPLFPPSRISDPDFHLDEQRMECSSCHDVHDDSNYSSSGVHFWRKPTWSGVCVICHLP